MRNYFHYLKLLPRMLFSREPMLDSGSQAWIITNMFWAKTQQGDLRIFDEARLVLPIDAHFPARVMGPEEAAQSTFAAVQQHAGLAHWPARLVALQPVDELAFDHDPEPGLESMASELLPDGPGAAEPQNIPQDTAELLQDEGKGPSHSSASSQSPVQNPAGPAVGLGAGEEQDGLPVAEKLPDATPSETQGSSTVADGEVQGHADTERTPDQVTQVEVPETGPEELHEGLQELHETHDSGMEEMPTMVFEYDPVLVHNRDVMVASFALGMASWWLGFTDPQSRPDPEGGALVELVAVMMGFGVFLANTAPQNKRAGCGACADAALERPAALSREEILFALALWCRNKGLGPRHVRAHLDSSMKGLFREAWRLSRR